MATPSRSIAAGGGRFAAQRHMMGIPPTDNPISFDGLTLARIKDGKIVEEWSFTNTLALLMQMGALPADVLGG